MSRDTTLTTSNNSASDPYDPQDEEAVARFWEGAEVTQQGAVIGTARRPGVRGKQKRETKISTTIRFDAEVVEFFRAAGEGWQTRINEVLREYVSTHCR